MSKQQSFLARRKAENSLKLYRKKIHFNERIIRIQLSVSMKIEKNSSKRGDLLVWTRLYYFTYMCWEFWSDRAAQCSSSKQTAHTHKTKFEVRPHLTLTNLSEIIVLNVWLICW